MTGASDDSSGAPVVKILDAIWDLVVYGESSFRPDKSCYELYEEYKKSGVTPDECVSNLINWQLAKTAASGFVLGLPGLAALPLTIPADLSSVAYIQLRMVVVIGLLYGWDAKSDRFRTVAYLSLLGTSGGEVLRAAGVTVGSRVSANLIKKIPGKVLIEINKKVGFRLLTKAGEKGVINLMKLVPVLGGAVGGGINAFATRQIGKAATAMLKTGPVAKGAS